MFLSTARGHIYYIGGGQTVSLEETRMTTFIKTKYQIHIKINLTMDGRPGIDYRVASLFKSYLIVIGIIPESMKSIGQF